MICRSTTLVVGMTLLLMAAPVRGEALTVSELAEKIEQWRAGRKIPPPVTYQVEGRASRPGPHLLQFKNSAIRFESPTELPQSNRRNPNVEVTGMVLRDEATGAYSFRIDSAREMPSDLETYFERKRQLRGQPPEKWYELGDWAARRGEFYKDAELIARSEEANQLGFELERKTLVRDNPIGLIELADKGRAHRLPIGTAEELIHEAAFLLWRESKGQTGAKLKDLLGLIAERLPGNSEKLDTEDTELQRKYVELQKKYFTAPRETYQAADWATRRKLHRFLYADVLLRTITPELSADGSNGFDIADRIDAEIRDIPEYHALAEKYRDQALEARSREVRNLSKSDLLALAQDYRNRRQTQAADHVIESWLTLRQRRLAPDDTEGLIQLTEEYRTLLKRPDVADRLLKEGWKSNKQATDIAERLQRAGYRLLDGQWLSNAEVDARPEGHLQQAIRAGRIEVGMNPSHVRRSLGEPLRIARAATYGEVNEVWTYDQTGSAQLTVRFRRGKGGSELSVVEVAGGGGRN